MAAYEAGTTALGRVVAHTVDAAHGSLRLDAASNLALAPGASEVTVSDRTTHASIRATATGQWLEIASSTPTNKVVVGSLAVEQTGAAAVSMSAGPASTVVNLKNSLEVDGSLFMDDDVLAAGALTGSSLAVTRTFQPSTASESTVGYGFAVDDRERLVLFKYDSANPDLPGNKVSSVMRWGIGKGKQIDPRVSGLSFPGTVGATLGAGGSVKVLASAPAAASQGSLYFDSTLNSLRVNVGGAWLNLSAPAAT